mmetsp:Transcript_3279/g.9085  ORF Transcript_3279/g.9085 Transcript_3279/m.9085 type:complete len:172 (-) Transcript_3279:84-599(-)
MVRTPRTIPGLGLGLHLRLRPRGAKVVETESRRTEERKWYHWMDRSVVPKAARRKARVLLEPLMENRMEPRSEISTDEPQHQHQQQQQQQDQKNAYLPRLSVVGILPTTLDTPANREAMPSEDFAKWTQPADVAREIGVWLVEPALRPHSGSLIKVHPKRDGSGAEFLVAR